ncbi:MAG: S-layer homology domain-containing protein [Oscillospiraceae bacterium]|nr:S-layer homology domain-containing protein [Oscillospiraceae bacterium]
MKVRSIISLVLALIMTLSLSVTAFAAPVYSDLEGHWAKEYMEDLSDKGFLTGYDDGTMRPNQNITYAEALVFISRFYDLDAQVTEWIKEDYSDIVDSCVPSAMDWAKEGITVCLGAGIIMASELKDASLGSEIQKEVLCKYLARAIQIPLPDSRDVKFSFNDANTISAGCARYVMALVNTGIVNGDANNNFTPNLSVTRAVVATMVSRSLKYLDENNVELFPAAYEGMSLNTGIVYAASAKALQLRTYDGQVMEFAIGADTKVTANDKSVTLDSTYVGCAASVKDNNGSALAVTVSSSKETWIQGSIFSLTKSNTSPYMMVLDVLSGDKTRYNILPNKAKITLDGKESSLAGLTGDLFITFKVEDRYVTEIIAATSKDIKSGEIKELNFATVVNLKVVDEDNYVWCYQMPISSLPTVKRGDTAITIDMLSVGDLVSVSMVKGAADVITTVNTQEELSGVLSSITSTTSGTEWVIVDNEGAKHTFTVDPMAKVSDGKKELQISDVKAGDSVTVTLFDSTITEVRLAQTVTAISKISGTVLAVDTVEKKITLLDDNKLIYVSAGSPVIADAVKGVALKLSGISENSKRTVYGTFENSTTIKATVVIVEG